MTVRPAAALVVAVLLSTGCSGGGDAPTAEQTVLPGTGGDFVGARRDVGAVDCRRDGERWAASSTVTNPSAEPADYRIYISFVDAEGATLELEQVDVRAVSPGGSREWEGTAELAQDGLQCLLRVERLVRR